MKNDPNIPAALARFHRLQHQTKEILASNPEHVAWLIRHSIRDRIPMDPDLRDVSITREGQWLASRLGENLDTRVGRWISSPMQRCVQTISGIRQGQNRNSDSVLQQSRHLGDPGPFVDNAEVAWNAYARLGKHALVDTLIKTPYLLDGFVPVKQGISTLLQTLRAAPNLESRRADESSITLACSHDIIMAVLLSYISKTGLTADYWPEFTEGVLIAYYPGHIVIHYRELRCEYYPSFDPLQPANLP